MRLSYRPGGTSQMRLNYPLFMAQQDTDSIFKNLAKKILVAKDFMAGITFK